MAAKQDPISGLTYGWSLGEDNWNTGMDSNLVKLGSTVNISILDFVATPVIVTNGTRYIVTTGSGAFAGQDNKLAVRVEDVWVFYTLPEGCIVYDQDTNAHYKYEAGAYVLVVDLSNYLTSSTIATGSVTGFLSSSDWTTFNNKQDTLPQASGSVSGYLSSSDWTTFNNKASLASPAFTGTPTAPTATTGTNTTQLATTAFVQTAVTAGAATGYTIVSNSSTSFIISSSYVTTAGKTIVKLTSGSLGNITINGATDDGKSTGDSFTIYVPSPAAGTTLVASGVTLEGTLAFTASSKLKTLIRTDVDTWLVLGG